MTVGILDNTVQQQNIGVDDKEHKEEKYGDDHDDIEKLSFRMSLQTRFDHWVQNYADSTLSTFSDKSKIPLIESSSSSKPS